MRRAVSRRFLDCLVDRSGLVDVHVRWFLREVVNVLVSKSQGCARRMGDNRFVVVAVAIVIASSSVSIMRRAVSRRFLDCLVDRSGLVDVRWFIGCLDLRSLLVDVLAWSWSLREDVVDLLRARALIGKTPVLRFQALVSSRGCTAWQALGRLLEQAARGCCLLLERVAQGYCLRLI